MQEIYKVVGKYNLTLNIKTITFLLQVAQSINLLRDSNLRNTLSHKNLIPYTVIRALLKSPTVIKLLLLRTCSGANIGFSINL